MEVKKYIDVEKVLMTKAPTLYKILPRFAINWLKRKLHEDDINKGMIYLEQFHELEFNTEVLKFLDVKLEVSGHENLPLKGGVIVAANHPLGGLDGMALIKAIGDKRNDVRFIVNDILKNIKNYGDVFVGVNKVGGQSRNSLQFVEQIYATESAILVFPAGLVSRKFKEGIRDLEWNKSFINKSIKYNKPIVPVFIEGQNSRFFYNFAKWRKRLGIKANLEMLFLPDEMFKQKGNTIKIHFGKIIEPSLFYANHTPQKWSNIMHDYIYTNAIKSGITFREYVKNMK
ncbi:MAG: 1-acyl-sn-glycerol-3-phosphate acyltransferase [Sphingobacteriaceae bacterium]|nr:1-acyl-sn-glycerol-3-phosphate acyltransferase [Sphingobacteriaceae bacterium]